MTEETKPTLEVGQYVRFLGYPDSATADEDFEAILEKGELVKVIEVGKSGNHWAYTVRALKADGSEDRDRKGEQLFDGEFEVAEAPEAPEVAPAAEETKAEEAPAEPAAEAVTDMGGTEPETAVEAPEKAKAEPKPSGKGKGKATKPKATKGKGSKGKKAEQKQESETAPAEPEAPAETAPTEPAEAAPAEQQTDEAPAADPEVVTQPGETAPQETEAPAAETNSEAPAIDLERGVFEHDPVVQEIIRGTNDIMAACLELSAQHEEIYFKMGGLLAEAKRNELHVAAGYEDSADGFNRFASERAGVGERKAYHLQRIYRTFRMAGISAEHLREIGWTKCRVLAKVPVDLLARDRDDLLKQARSQTRDELEASVKTTYEDTSSETDRVQKNTYKFQAVGDACSLIEQALDAAKGRTENGDINQAFELILTEWLATLQEGGQTQAGMVPMPKSREELQEIAQAAGYEIEVVGAAEQPAEQQPAEAAQS